MDIKKISFSLSLVATLTLQTFADNSNNYIQEEQNAIQFAKQLLINHKTNSEIALIFNELIDAYQQFNENVIVFLHSKITDFAREDSQRTGQLLGSLAFHNDEKIKFYKELKKIVKKNKFSKEMKRALVTLEHLSKDFKKEIQIFIDISYMEIEAKNYFKALKVLHTQYKFNDYWYSASEVYNDEIVLFLSLDSFDGDIFDIEDRLNSELLSLKTKKQQLTEGIALPNIGGFNFDKMNKSHFTRVSLI